MYAHILYARTAEGCANIRLSAVYIYGYKMFTRRVCINILNCTRGRRARGAPHLLMLIFLCRYRAGNDNNSGIRTILYRLALQHGYN